MIHKEKHLSSALTNEDKVSEKGKSVKELSKELCEKSGCHHKCHDTKDCVVEDEALLLINENKSNNFDVKSNNELFKQALVEGVSRYFDKIIEQEKQIDEIAKLICTYPQCIHYNIIGECANSECQTVDIAERLYNAGYRKQSDNVIELPCKVGDTVYVITNCENILMYHDNDYFTGTGAIECPFESSCDFEECNDSNLRIFKTMVKVIHCEEGFGWNFWCEHLNKDFEFSEIGTTVFLTQEEAEQALAKMKGGEEQ